MQWLMRVWQHTAIIQHGTPEMLVMIRHLLFVVGRELAAQDAPEAAAEGDGPEQAA